MHGADVATYSYLTSCMLLVYVYVMLWENLPLMHRTSLVAQYSHARYILIVAIKLIVHVVM